MFYDNPIKFLCSIIQDNVVEYVSCIWLTLVWGKSTNGSIFKAAEGENYNNLF